jgi:protein gp37
MPRVEEMLMGAITAIEWTDATWNPVGGCSIKSPGCTNCYAQGLAGRRLKHLPLYAGTTTPSNAGPVFNGHLTRAADDADVWSWPVRWRGAKNPRLGPGKPSMIFVGDMADLFHEDRPRADIDRAVAAIIYSPHIGQFLTKRPAVMRDYFTELRDSGRWLMFDHPILGRPNFEPVVADFDAVFARCWAMTSVEDQRRADERIPELLAVPLPVHGLSVEPLLGPFDLDGSFWRRMRLDEIPGCALIDGAYDWFWRRRPSLDWVIAGGESGPGARPMHPAWARALRDQCAAAGVPFFFKQMGEWLTEDQFPAHLDFDDRAWRHADDLGDVAAGSCEWPGIFARVGRRAAGHLLDGREHSEFPA